MDNGQRNVDVEKTIEALERRGYTVTIFGSVEEVTAYLDWEIDETTVGFGDSQTLSRMHLFERLESHNEVHDPQHLPDGAGFDEVAKSCLATDVFVTSANAVAETGEIVNIDGSGNRIAGSLFGHRKVYFVLGANKLVPTLEDAIWRARNVAAPRNAQRLGLNTPCAKDGQRCFECSASDRICNAMAIYLGRMSGADTEVIIVNEPLGF